MVDNRKKTGGLVTFGNTSPLIDGFGRLTGRLVELNSDEGDVIFWLTAWQLNVGDNE